jgi:hypothetical protein
MDQRREWVWGHCDLDPERDRAYSAIALIPILFILSLAGKIMLRPLSKRLGDLLQLMIEDRSGGALMGSRMSCRHWVQSEDGSCELRSRVENQQA